MWNILIHLILVPHANGEQWRVHLGHWMGDLGPCPLLFSLANDSNKEQQIEITFWRMINNLNLKMSDDYFPYSKHKNKGDFVPQKGLAVCHSIRVTCLSLNKDVLFLPQNCKVVLLYTSSSKGKLWTADTCIITHPQNLIYFALFI